MPWKREEDEKDDNGAIQQTEFPSWASNKEYLAYNSPSATFLGNFRFRIKSADNIKTSSWPEQMHAIKLFSDEKLEIEKCFDSIHILYASIRSLVWFMILELKYE